MNIESARQIISDNYNCNENSLVYALHEKCEFSVEKFWEYYESIAAFAGTNEKSSELTKQITESYQKILKEIIYHFDPTDVAVVEHFPVNYTAYLERIDFALLAYDTGNTDLLDDERFELQRDQIRRNAMLKKLLSHSECAACKGCCMFESYDIWNTPVLSNETRRKAEEFLPEAEFVSAGAESWRFRIRKTEEQFPCPLLDPEKGCLLGEEKPIMCRLYPFQIAELNGRQMITLSPLCDALMQKPIGELLRFVKEELAEDIFTYAAAHPDEVQPYDGLSLILLWKPQEI